MRISSKRWKATEATSPRLWWLGHCGFAVKYHGMVFYVDPACHVSDAGPAHATNADLILCTHAHPGHMDPAALPAC